MIDFDNVTMAIRSDLQTELKRLLQSEIIRGKVAVQRAYADWRRYPQYIVPLSESSIDLIFAPAHGANKKNATDIRLAIDALELVFTRPEIGTFILLSGDSDFSSLVLKLKEYGKYIIGVGIRESSSDLLIQNCDEYYSYNELAGLTKESDVTHERHDPWELVVEAVKQMTAHNDVMRSDRLKQVMQEIDPSFDEKDAGFSRFSKFVVEAAHRGLITLTKLDNGQYEIALGPEVVGAAAQPAGGRMPSAREHEGPPARERSGGRGRRGGRDRGASVSAAGAGEGAGTAAPDDASQIDDGAYAATLPAASEHPAQEADGSTSPQLGGDAGPAPAAPGGVPSRSARFRRGSRGGRVAPPEIPKIGVVEVDPNFKPRIELVPPKRPVAAPAPFVESGIAARNDDGPRAGEGRGRGGRGSGRGGRGAESGEREPAERSRGRRGGRGRGGRRRPAESGGGERFEARHAPASAPTPPASPPPAPPVAAEPPDDPGGESFWSKVKRGLTGGT